MTYNCHSFNKHKQPQHHRADSAVAVATAGGGDDVGEELKNKFAELVNKLLEDELKAIKISREGTGVAGIDAQYLAELRESVRAIVYDFPKI